MDVSGVGLNDALMYQATAMKGSQVSQQISIAVMKQMQDMEQMQAEALLKMMAQSGIGQNLNVSV